MQHLLHLFFRLPPLGYIVLAALAIYFGMNSRDGQIAAAETRAAALAAPTPKPIALGDFTWDDIGLASEINIAAQINTNYNYRLHRGEGEDSNARAMWLLFDPQANGSEREVKAAIVIPNSDADEFLGWIFKNIHDQGKLGPVFHFNGAYQSTVSYDDVAREAIEKEGLRRASRFFYIEPWVNGRAAALAPRASQGMTFSQTLNCIALFLIALAALKFVLRRNANAAKQRQSFHDQPIR
ncbi:hypothetical protein [Yoonia maritima]|uniref:hypothetical protein n=1 Tax=Yoonia maritima TaxID=1435347 RepID=UPI001A9C7A13|nr:hypothetical protein [Yoonia maritima]